MEHKYQNSHAQAVDRNRWFIRKVVLLVKIAVTHVVDDSFSTYNQEFNVQSPNLKSSMY